MMKLSLSLVILAAWIPWALAHENHATTAKPSEPSKSSRAESPSPDREAKQRNYFTDLELVNQDGRKVLFYTDILKDRVVLINFFFANCVEACPLQSKVLADLQPMLGDRLGKEIFLISVGVDPERDSPVAMKKYAEKFGSQHGWIFLSGKKDHVNHILYKLGQYNENIEEHSTASILGNAKTDRWEKVRPNATADVLATLLLGLAEENGGVAK